MTPQMINNNITSIRFERAIFSWTVEFLVGWFPVMSIKMLE
jgi:hypothetical protein